MTLCLNKCVERLFRVLATVYLLIFARELFLFTHTFVFIQSTLVISTSVISNNRLSRRKNLVLDITQKSKIRLYSIVEMRRNCSWGAISPLFHNIFNIHFYLKESNYIIICKNWLFKLFFPQYYKSDMSKYGYLELF